MRPFSALKKFGTPDALIYGANVVLPCCARPGTVGHASPYMERAPDGECGPRGEKWEAKK